ncbi:MAG: hypothetical protein R3B13_19225 [Polyangiaceae bacterium]
MKELPRLHLFEFNDSAWAGQALRDNIVETLSLTLRWGRMLRGLVDPYCRFLDDARTQDVLDLCAGAGGPALVLCEEFRRAGRRPPQILMTDLFPRSKHWTRLQELHPEVLSFVDQSVNATAIPEDLSAGRARTIINAFHHFTPSLARSILKHAVESRTPIFVSEAFHRNPALFASFAPAALLAMFANPVLTEEPSLKKALLAWLTPVTLGAGMWDGLVSTMRVYTERELRAMSEPLGGGYRWTFEPYAAPLGGRGYVYYGIPE